MENILRLKSWITITARESYGYGELCRKKCWKYVENNCELPLQPEKAMGMVNYAEKTVFNGGKEKGDKESKDEQDESWKPRISLVSVWLTWQWGGGWGDGGGGWGERWQGIKGWTGRKLEAKDKSGKYSWNLLTCLRMYKTPTREKLLSFRRHETCTVQ